MSGQQGVERADRSPGGCLFEFTGAVLESYWIPLAGSQELFVHYGADITAWAAERLLLQQNPSGTGCKSCRCG